MKKPHGEFFAHIIWQRSKAMALLFSFSILWMSVNAAEGESFTLCVKTSVNRSGRTVAPYVSDDGTCMKGFRAIPVEQREERGGIDQRLREPIVGVPYEYHLDVGGSATGWALLQSDGVWTVRIRISWAGADGIRLETGRADSGFYPGLTERALETPLGVVFAWFESLPDKSTFPIFHAAWSDGTRRYCSKLDIHDKRNTLEYFNVDPDRVAQVDRRYCPDDGAPPASLLNPPFGQSYRW